MKKEESSQILIFERVVKMKKAIAVLLIALLATMFLASCGGVHSASDIFYNQAGMSGSGGSSYPSEAAPAPAPAPSSTPAPGGMQEGDGGSLMSNIQSDGSGMLPITATVVDEGLAEKIIYTVSADIESLNFDETIDKVYEMLAHYRAFIESSYIGGRNRSHMYYGWQEFRYASFTLRVPKDSLNAITASLDTLGNVTALRSDAQNITAMFTDTEARLVALAIQEERLLDMLRKAEDIPDLIVIEERLSEVRYQIESITATLRNWQNQVDYSTLNLYISEVEAFTEITQVQQRTYWQRVGDGLQSNTLGVGQFFTSLFMWLVVSLPVLIILAVIVILIVLLVKRQIKRRKKRDISYTGYNPYAYNSRPSSQNVRDPQNAQNVQDQQNINEPENAPEQQSGGKEE